MVAVSDWTEVKEIIIVEWYSAYVSLAACLTVAFEPRAVAFLVMEESALKLSHPRLK